MQINIKQTTKIILTSLIAALACAGIIQAATTVGTNISTTGTLTATGLTTIGSASSTLLSVSGTTYIGGSTGLILADGSITDASGVISFGNENLSTTGTLNITGLTTLGNASTTVLSVSGNTYIAGILSVTGNSIFTTVSSADDGLKVLTGNLVVGNACSAITPDGEDLCVDGDVGVDGDFTATGDVGIGAAETAGKKLTLSSGTASDMLFYIIPHANQTGNIWEIDNPGAVTPYVEMTPNGFLQVRREDYGVKNVDNGVAFAVSSNQPDSDDMFDLGGFVTMLTYGEMNNTQNLFGLSHVIESQMSYVGTGDVQSLSAITGFTTYSPSADDGTPASITLSYGVSGQVKDKPAIGAGVAITDAIAVMGNKSILIKSTFTNVYNFKGLAHTDSDTGDIVNAIGLGLEKQDDGSNSNIQFLSDTSSIPAGNWGIYENTGYPNYFSGSLTVGSVDIWANELKIGANTGGTITRNDGEVKSLDIVVPHKTNAEEAILLLGVSATAAQTFVLFGGGSSTTYNTATKHEFYTAPNNTTTSGTLSLALDGFLNAGSGDEKALELIYTIDKASSGDAYGLKITPTDTTVPANHYALGFGNVTGNGTAMQINLNGGTGWDADLIRSNGQITCSSDTCTDIPGDYAVYITTENAGGADVLSIANGIQGQEKLIVFEVDGTDNLTITPVTYASGTSITCTTAGDTAHLHYNTAIGWVVTSLFGCTDD